MHPVQAEMWDPQPPFKHASPIPPHPPSGIRLAHVTSAAPAKRITFYKSGDSQFGGVRMAIHKRSFKCFDALLDDLSQKVPLPFGVRTVTTPRGTHAIKHLEQLQDGGCYLCSDRRQAKPVNMELASKRPSIWYYHGRRPHRPEYSPTPPPSHSSHRQRRILLVKNSEPGMRRSVVLSRRSTRSLRAFLDEASEDMQFHVRKLYTAEGRRIDNVQSLMTCPGVLVCVGREAFSPMLVNFIRKSSEEKLPGLGTRSPGLGPRTPGNGARSPATQGARSPPHGAQSRASEYSEGQESKKNVNFGLETKKSIIHPRSDSSNRSARFSLSSEKSYVNGANSHARPTITNDDIEKRVLVNKDGSLSVEMRVRFRLHNDETLQWSTQVKKSPGLTECCSLGQTQSHYLQQGRSESCSDPDSTSFDPDGSRCPCCYQKPEQQYDLWENPAHIHQKPPVPPPHTSSHTMRRHTHSSSSSSSCNSRRLVRCRARVSNCGGGSQQSLVQEEMFVTEQVEHRVEQDEDMHVEVCRVSRCCSRSEVVAVDSRKSAEDELIMEEEGQRPLSAISSSSHVLQSLKEDDDFPPSPSHCCHSNEPSASPTSHLNDNPTGNDKEESTSSCHCGAEAPSSMSRASCSSGKAKITNSEEEEAADDEDEEIKRAGSGLSGHTGLSLQSRASSVCPDCGGCKRGVNSYSDSRASLTSPKPPTPLSGHANATNGSDDDAAEGSDESTQSNKSNLTNDGHCSTTSNVLKKEEERTSSATSHRSNGSHKSDCKGSTCGAAETEEERSSSAVSAKSSKSHKSNCGGATGTREDAEGKRAPSALSAKSGASATTTASPSALSVEPGKAERPETALSAKSAKSTKSNVSAKSGVSHRSTCSHCARAVSPGTKEAAETEATGQEGSEPEERAASAMSAKSNLSAKSNKSHKSTKAPERPLSARSGTGEDGDERAASQVSGRSVKSNKSSKSCQSNSNGKVKENKEVEERISSAMSGKSHTSAKSSKSHKSNGTAASASPNEADIPSLETNENQERVASVMSAKSKSSCTSSPNVVTIKTPDGDDEEGSETTVRAAFVKSRKSNVSSVASHKSNRTSMADVVVHETADVREEDAPRSKSQGQTLLPRRAQLSPGETRGPSALSVHSTTSAKSGSSKCRCGATSANEGEKNEEASERSASIRTSSTKRQRRESGGTEKPLSRNSSGSVSLGLPEDQDTADSDSGKSSVSVHTHSGREGKMKTTSPHIPKSTDQSKEGEGTGSVMSPKSNSKSTPSQSAVEIPTIETPGESEDKGEEGGEQTTERALSAKSSRSSGTCCNCKAGRTSGSPTKAGNDLETQSVKSSSTSKAHENRTSSAASSASAKDRSKSSTRGSAKNAKVAEDNDTDNQAISRPASEAKGKGDIADRSTSVHSKSPYCLRPDSAKTRSRGSVKTNSSQEKEVKSSSPCPLHGGKVETRSESTLSHSLSAADMLKETMASARPHSRQSKGSKTSGKSRSGRGQNQTDLEELELSPACLPNASPNEVVSDWLRSIPTNSSMLALGDEPNEEEQEKVEAKEEEIPEKVEDEAEEEEKEETAQCEPAEGLQSSEPAPEDGVGASSRPDNKVSSGEPLPRSLHSSAAVMKVLLSSSLGRCQSMPEVSSVYGRRLSTSAQGLLDCLAQLQLIEPSGSPGFDQQKDRRYEDIMAILQSLWLTEPGNIDTKDAKDINTEQVSPPRSSSGVGMSSGSAGSGKENDNQGGDKTQNKKSLQEDEGVEKAVEAEEEGHKEMEAKTKDTDQSTVPTSPDSPKATENPSSTDKSSAKESSKSTTDNEPETPEDSSSGTPPTVLRAPLSKKISQEPDPVWIMHLLKKLEKQFMNHYINAMAEFKVRWDLDDSVILDTMIGELRDEVSRRIHSSIECEVGKIQSRAGRGGRAPQRGILSKESTMTDKRRKILKVMKKQSVKTGDSLSDTEMTGEFSDQRSDDEYCPCDACVRKKMAARPLKANPPAAEAPVMMEFDLLKILQLKKSPSPAVVLEPTDGGVDSEVTDEEVRSLEVVREEEEEEETKDDIKADVVLEETIQEEDEETGKDGEGDEAEEVEVDAEEMESSAGDEEEEEGEEAGEEDTSENGEEEEEVACQCQSARNEEETSDNTGEDETGDDEERAGEEEEESGKETGKDGEGETTENGEEEAEEREEMDDSDDTKNEESPSGEGVTTEGDASASAEDEDDAEEEETQGEEGGESEEQGGEPSEEDRASAQGQGVTEGEEADAEDSDTDNKRPRDSSAEESRPEETGATGGEEEQEDAVEEVNKKEDGFLRHQFTKTSVESQPGSLEDMQDADSPQKTVDSIKVPKMAAGVSAGGGAGQRRSRSPGRVKCRKPKDGDAEMDDF